MSLCCTFAAFRDRALGLVTGDKSRLRFDCVEELLAEGVIEHVGSNRGDVGALESGED